MQTFVTDANHFNNLQPPLAPNSEEVKIYKEYTDKSDHVLLLGYTKELRDLADICMDLNFPDGLETHCKLVKQDWFTIGCKYDTIIADGALNLVGGDLVTHLSKFCRTLVVRFFTKRIEGMKYATYFQENTPMLLPDKIVPTQKKCLILVWKFER